MASLEPYTDVIVRVFDDEMTYTNLTQIGVQRCSVMSFHMLFQDYTLRRKGQMDDNFLEMAVDFKLTISM